MIKQRFIDDFGLGGLVILWRKNLKESTMTEDRLRVYVNPMDAPGRAKGSFQTMEALRVVLQEDESHAMEEVRRDLERARMTAEDYRQGSGGYDERCGTKNTETYRSYTRELFDTVWNYDGTISEINYIAREARGTQEDQQDALEEIRVLAYTARKLT